MNLSRRQFGKLIVGGLAGGSGLLPAAAAPDAGRILAKADAIRNPQSSFVVDVSLRAFKGKRLTDETRVTTHSRKSGRGQFKSIVHVNSPSADRGKLILRNGNILWMYDPSSKASVRISPRQRMLGNASNGDVVSSNLVGDYRPSYAGEETIVDGGQQKKSCHKLNLKAITRSAPYSRVELWVDTGNFRPLKGKYYTKSGELIKVAWYRGWKSQMGAVRPTEIVIVDGFDPNSVTIMTMNRYRPKNLPNSWFHKEWLPRFEL